MQQNQKIFHIISNTHWDREWRFSFQRNRQMLVDMMDRLLDILENEPDYRAFHLDSQSIVLDDYLEIKPHNKERIIKLTREDRLLHGPWYILPEEFQVGGENLIRNLLLGHKVSSKHGGVSKIGYSPFSWGQISQLPQIYRQFDINLIMFYRGINSKDSPKAEFLWEGADGTEMVSSRFSTMPRYNFYFYIYRPAVHNQQPQDIERGWNEDHTPFHFADLLQQDEDYFIISPHEAYYPETIEPQVKKIIEDQAGDFTTRHVIWMEGHDSSGPNRQTVDIIRDIKKKFPELDVRHSTLEEYAAHIAESVEWEKLTRVEGERRSAQNNLRCGNLFGYTTSARMYLKQANFNAERWLQYYAEPFNIFSGMFGRDIEDQYPEKAWKLLIQNSAHDSIGGCSRDRIHEDMMQRYKQSVEISKGVFERSLKGLIPQLNTGNFTLDSELYLTVINPTNYERSEVAVAYIDIPTDMDLGNFKLVDEAGKELDKVILGREKHQPVLEQMINRPTYFDMMRYHVRLKAVDMPVFGLKTVQVVPTSAKAKQSSEEKEENVTLENDYIRVSVNKDGTLNLRDKSNQTEYNGIGYFEDEGEAGHAWVHESTEPVVSTQNSGAEISITEQNSLYKEIRVRHHLVLPANLEQRQVETGEMVVNTIDLFVGLHSTDKFVRLNVEVDNRAESHRLRLMIPTGLMAAHSYGEGQFDVVERSLERPNTSDWIEQPMYDFPMHHFVDLSDGNKGLAVLVDGLKEYEVLPDAGNTLAITLFRTFEYKINPAAPQDYSHEKGAQMLGRPEYSLAICPHEGNWQQGEVMRNAFQFNYPLRLVQHGSVDGELGSQTSLMKISPDELVFSALKKPESGENNAAVLRIYNPTEERIEGTVWLLKQIEQIKKLDLQEETIKTADLMDDHSFEAVLDAKEIATYKIIYK